MKTKTTLLMIIGMLATMSITAQEKQAPAFPGAEGFGRYTTGGRAGTLYHVTNLNDSGTGSLRAALTASGTRTVVFDVSGTIHLKSDLKISNGNITVLGQTAPGDGICVADYPVSVSANNVIIRYVRFRMGDIGSQAKAASNPNYEGDDALGGGKGKNNIIIDHCSVSWSTDECCSFYGATDFTMQYCIISESLRASVHAKGSHGYGGIWGGQSASFHHNLIMHHDSRNPRFDHDYVSTLKGPVDYINNVLYNWGGNSSYGGESGNGSPKYINMVNNYYKPGPATYTKTRLLNPTTNCSNCTDKNRFSGSVGYVTPGQFYISGNYMYGSTEVTNDNLCDKAIDPDNNMSYADWKNQCAASERKKSSDYDFTSYNVISMHQAETAFEKVLRYAGASYKRDDVDKRLRWEVLKGIAYYQGSNGSVNGMIDSQNDVGGWPELKDTGKLADTDNDGIPDEWETAHGLTVGTNNATTKILDQKGYYTDLEVYANYLVQEITQKERAGAVETFEEYYPLGAQTVGDDEPFPTTPDFPIPEEPTSGTDFFNSNKATTSKGTEISVTSCTLNGEVNPSGSSGNYIKLRTGSGDWIFTNKEGYILNSIKIEAYQNNKESEYPGSVIKMTAIKADDGNNLLTEEVSLPFSDSGKKATVSCKDFTATQNIKVSFENTTYTNTTLDKTSQMQCFAIVSIGYEKTTDIKDITHTASRKQSSDYHNVLGQRVAPTTRGLLIHNGKKILVK